MSQGRKRHVQRVRLLIKTQDRPASALTHQHGVLGGDVPVVEAENGDDDEQPDDDEARSASRALRPHRPATVVRHHLPLRSAKGSAAETLLLLFRSPTLCPSPQLALQNKHSPLPLSRQRGGGGVGETWVVERVSVNVVKQRSHDRSGRKFTTAADV